MGQVNTLSGFKDKGSVQQKDWANAQKNACDALRPGEVIFTQTV